MILLPVRFLKDFVSNGTPIYEKSTTSVSIYVNKYVEFEPTDTMKSIVS